MPQALSFDGIKKVATIPNGGTSTDGINVPVGYSTLTVITPSALTVSTAWKLQMLVPNDAELNPTWVDLASWNFAAATVPLSVTFAASQATTFLNGVFGGGQIRITVADAQGAARQFVCFFTNRQN